MCIATNEKQFMVVAADMIFSPGLAIGFQIWRGSWWIALPDVLGMIVDLRWGCNLRLLTIVCGLQKTYMKQKDVDMKKVKNGKSYTMQILNKAQQKSDWSLVNI